MAGFVMNDSRFTKNPDREGQRTDLVKAIKSGGSETPLYITDERRKALESDLKVITRAGGNINEMQYDGMAPSGKKMRFVLKRTMDAPGATGKILWAVFYAAGEVRLSNDLKSPNKGSAENLLPVMATVDIKCPPKLRGTYRSATTGDYDLWAIFPPRKNFDHKGADARMVPGSDRHKTPLKNYIENEDAHKGNLSVRIEQIRNALNEKVRSLAGYTGGDVVHHSDEAGRPMITSIDFPCIVFVPGVPDAYCVESVPDLKALISDLMFKYVITLNPGWHRQLGISVSKGGSYEV